MSHLAARRLVVEDVDAVKLGIVVAGVEAVAANAVLVADDLPELWRGRGRRCGSCGVA